MSKAIGSLGEQLVSHWLENQGWQILHHQWYCRYGEIDLIALQRESKDLPILSFVEVKTRSQRNWDQGGRLAITLSKQAKLIQSAELFLSDHPNFIQYSCRFDVALVRCDRYPHSASTTLFEDIPTFPNVIKVGQPFSLNGYRLLLQDYIESAFS
ncbi:MAG: YraN family protein [Planktothrix sp.]|uniref:YraN family protein n=1 Tax=Planktothrix sp. TaxID=3088171 RepID=UPI0038D4EF2B